MKKVLILFGGNSFEHEISCKSVNFIIKNIDRNKYYYRLVGIGFNNNWYELNKTKNIDINWANKIKFKIKNIIEYAKKFDIVFPVMHGNTIEDGKLQALFELNNIKYVGSNSYNSLICYDKLLTKLILEKYNILQIPYVIYNKNTNLDNIIYPVIVKPCKCGSSIGITIAHNKDEIKYSIEEALKYDKNILIEKYIEDKRELECAILEYKNSIVVSDIGEILNDGNYYDFNSKYKSDTKTIISSIDKNIKDKIKYYSKLIFNILGCKKLSRIDFIYDIKNNILYFNEINTMPGFTKDSMYPKLIKNIGINYKKLVSILIDI